MPDTPMPTRSAKPPVTGLVAMFLILGLLLGGVVVFGLVPRLQKQRDFLRAAGQDSERLPVVRVATVARAPAQSELQLPGTLQALNEASIYARVDGYIKRRLVEIGEPVKNGQLMMELDTPELDQQLQQAEASVSQAKAAVKQLEAAIRQAKANARLAQVTADRTRKLTAEGVLSRQELDDKEAVLEARNADAAAAEANLAAGLNAVAVSEANLRRLKEMKGFATIEAPFDGVITYRNPDVGTLISAGNNGPNREVFRVAQNDPMRVFVNVPQTYVKEVQGASGTKASFTVQQLPDRKFVADVRRTNAALDPASRTMLAVLYVENKKSELLPGMFGYVTFTVRDSVRPLIVPGDAMLTRPDGPYVAVVDARNTVHFRKVSAGRDLGTAVEVHEGLAEGEQVISSPTDEVQEGSRVQPRRADRKER